MTTAVAMAPATMAATPANATTAATATRNVAARNTATRTHNVPAGFPCGRRTPRGSLRWYLTCVPQGREDTTCERLRRVIGQPLLEDAFVMRKEHWFHRRGVWSLQPVCMYPGYIVVATRDVVALDRALRRLSFPVSLAGTDEHSFAPMSAEAQAWFGTSMDTSHTLRNSVASIVSGELRVQSGPLVGQEPRVLKIDRHKRSCLVGVSDADGGFTQSMPIDVPFKS